MVRGTLCLSALAVGVALEVVAGLGYGAGSVQDHRLSAVGTEHEASKQVWLIHVLGDTLFWACGHPAQYPTAPAACGYAPPAPVRSPAFGRFFVLVGQGGGALAGYFPCSSLFKNGASIP